MPIYKIDMRLKTTDGNDLGGQNWLTINYPQDNCWGICSSNAVISGRKGKWNASEKLGYEGTTCYKGDSTDIAFRLAKFRGGIIDQDSWDVGKGDVGKWYDVPTGIQPDFTWVILSIDDRDTPKKTSDASDSSDSSDYAYA